VYLAENPHDQNARGSRTRQVLKNKLTWIFALFLFGYVGAEGMIFSPLRLSLLPPFALVLIQQSFKSIL
jgi:fucose permease